MEQTTTERCSLAVFLTCLVLCASLILTLIWLGGPDTPDSEHELLFKCAGSTFVIGFGSALIWATSFLYRFFAGIVKHS